MINTEVISDSMITMMCLCSQCKKEIVKEVESFLELDGRFYHTECYHCQTCYKKFSLNESINSIVPIADHYGVLYCQQHFIRLLKCCICSREFDESSWICELQYPDDENNKRGVHNNRIAHAECIQCANCHRRISPREEYAATFSSSSCGGNSDDASKKVDPTATVAVGLRLSCKQCSKKQQRHRHQHHLSTSVNQLRLSTQQKETLTALIGWYKLTVENILDDGGEDDDDGNNGETHYNDMLIRLAKEIKCTPKCIVNYLSKRCHKEKKSPKSGVNETETTKKKKTKSPNELIVEELKSMESTTVYYTCPPNVYPFGRSSASTQINVLGDVTNSMIK